MPRDDPSSADFDVFEELKKAKAARKPPGQKLPDDDERPAEFSDDALALEFTRQYGADLRHVAAWGKWFQWIGAYWRIDDTLKTFDLARAICREASAEVPPANTKLAAAIASAKAVAAVVSLARSDRRHAAVTEQWDSNVWLILTDDGEVL